MAQKIFNPLFLALNKQISLENMETTHTSELSLGILLLQATASVCVYACNGIALK